MGARIYTPEEERVLKLRPLPDLPCPDPAKSAQLNACYSRARQAYRIANPDRTPDEDVGR